MQIIKCVDVKSTKMLKVAVNKLYHISEELYEIVINGQNEPEAHILDTKDHDSMVDLRVSDNGLKAELTIYPPLNEGIKYSFEALHDILVYDEGLASEMINLESLQLAYDMYKKGYIVESQLIATGILPIDGKDGYIKLHFKKPDFTPIEDEHGNVDYRSVNNIVNVEKDSVLATRYDPTEGKPGATVSGATIHQIPGNEAELRILKGVAFNPESKTYYATLDGHVVHDGKAITVNPVYIVEGDLDYHVGNISFNGLVLVNGDVRSGFKIEGKSIRVRGLCEDAQLVAKEDIILDKGIVSHGKMTIKAGRDVIAGHMENAVVYAGNSIHIKNYSMNSKLYSENEITAIEGDGIILGGEIYSFKSVTAHQLGSENAGSFKINVGKKYYLEDKIDQTIRERDRTEKKLEETDKRIAKINKDDPDVVKDPKMKQVLIARNLLANKLEKLNERIGIIIKESVFKEPFIKVRDRIFSGITFTFFSTDYIVRENGKHLIFYFDNEKKVVRVANFEEKVYFKKVEDEETQNS